MADQLKPMLYSVAQNPNRNVIKKSDSNLGRTLAKDIIHQTSPQLLEDTRLLLLFRGWFTRETRCQFSELDIQPIIANHFAHSRRENVLWMARNNVDFWRWDCRVESLDCMWRVRRAIGGIVVWQEGDAEFGEGIRWRRLRNVGEVEEVNCGGIMSGLLWGRCSETLHERNGFEVSRSRSMPPGGVEISGSGQVVCSKPVNKLEFRPIRLQLSSVAFGPQVRQFAG